MGENNTREARALLGLTAVGRGRCALEKRIWRLPPSCALPCGVPGGKHSYLGHCVGGGGGQQERGLGDVAKPAVVAGGTSQLEAGWGEQKVQTWAGQVPVQPCVQVCCSVTPADDFSGVQAADAKKGWEQGALCTGRSSGRPVCKLLSPHRSCLQIGLSKKRENNCTD